MISVRAVIRLVAVLLLINCACTTEHSIPFDSAGWRAPSASDGRPSLRQQMLKDLLRNHKLIGLSRSQVVTLLGESDTSGYFNTWDLVYRLGQERSAMPVDSEWLVLKLDAGGKVSNYKVLRD